MIACWSGCVPRSDPAKSSTLWWGQSRAWAAQLPEVDRATDATQQAAFWTFVAERHWIWHRRVVQQVPPPWTRDAVLQTRRFTNVYRELDRQSRWLITHIAQGTRSAPEKKLYATVVFRLFNRYETFTTLKWGVPWPDRWVGRAVAATRESALRQLHAAGVNPFTSAYVVFSGKGVEPDRIRYYLRVWAWWDREYRRVWERITVAPSLKAVHRVLQEIPGIGPFLAYELCCDLMYGKVIPFSEEDWVHVGPGARLGLRLLFPSATTRQYPAKIQELRDEQVRRLPKDFPYYQGRRLTLRNIEHSLCEYAKYWKMSIGQGKRRAHFVPQPIPRWLTDRTG